MLALADFSDEDLKGADLQLTAIQVKKLRREIQKLLEPPRPYTHSHHDGAGGLDSQDAAGGQVCANLI